ncbi:MAG: CvpA family protein [Rickettsiaceae bacterium]|nr:CvpA family protein [Rickettsiaceae bacterium]
MIFSLFDILVLAIFSISSVFGLYKGMIHITINLLGFIASIVSAIFLYSYVRIICSEYIENELLTTIASAASSYVISLIVFTLITSKVILLFGDTNKGSLDRLLGLVLGVARGGVFVLIIFAIIAIFTAGTYSKMEENQDIVNNLSMDKYPEWLKDSVTTPYLEGALKKIDSLVPDSVWESVSTPKKEEDTDVIESIKKQKKDDIKVISEVISG